MKKWKYEIAIRDLLGEDSSDAAVITASKGIAARLRKFVQDKKVLRIDLEEFAEWFDDMADSTEKLEADCDDFNDLLGCFYDWCDDNCLWVKF